MECLSILFVMPAGMQQEFGRLVSDQRMGWTGVETCDHARAELAKNPDISVVVSNATLPDGSWYCLLQELVRQEQEADLLVVVPAGCETKNIRSYGISGVVGYPADASAGTMIAEVVRRAKDRSGALSGG